jgi:hypothetical protein
MVRSSYKLVGALDYAVGGPYLLTFRGRRILHLGFSARFLLSHFRGGKVDAYRCAWTVNSAAAI